MIKLTEIIQMEALCTSYISITPLNKVQDKPLKIFFFFFAKYYTEKSLVVAKRRFFPRPVFFKSSKPKLLLEGFGEDNF